MLINLTGKDLTFIKDDGSKIEVPANYTPALVYTPTAPVGEADGVPIMVQRYAEPVNLLPSNGEDTFIVSENVLMASKVHHPDRNDLVIVSGPLYDKNNSFLGYTCLLKELNY